MTTEEALLSLHGIQRGLLHVEQQLDVLEIKENCMAVDATIVAVIKKIDDATTAIAVRIQKLIDAAKAAGSVSAADVVAALQPEVDKLTALGNDPAAPVAP